MLAIERRNAILEKLQEEKRVVVSELATLFEVSEETIRRDLEKLDNEGLAVKSYGGAVLNENMNLELPFNIRKNRNVIGKQKIAELVGEIVRDGDKLFLDSSSTAVAIARAIKQKNVTVVTNSLEIPIELVDAPDCKVISTGGELAGSSLALLGQMTDKAIHSYYMDKAIVSAKGIDTEIGITESDERHANNKKSMLHSAKMKILAIDNSKFDRIAFAKIGGFGSIDMIVTDKKPEDRWLEKFEEYNIECIYPQD